jgi:hypothetical protein
VRGKPVRERKLRERSLSQILARHKEQKKSVRRRGVQREWRLQMKQKKEKQLVRPNDCQTGMLAITY